MLELRAVLERATCADGVSTWALDGDLRRKFLPFSAVDRSSVASSMAAYQDQSSIGRWTPETVDQRN
jgi:hypothetical protein